MNERIKQLAEQAGFILWGEEDYNPGDVVDWSTRYDDELVKFTQLVAEQCVKILETRSDHAVIVNSVKEIKEQFGLV